MKSMKPRFQVIRLEQGNFQTGNLLLSFFTVSTKHKIMNKLHHLLALAACMLLLEFCLITTAAAATYETPQENITATNGVPDPNGLDGQPMRKKKVPPPPPPQKTKYDKLPLNELLAKANKGDLTAQFELGSRYNYGRNLPKDTTQALHWLRKAARAGDVNSERLLAVKFYNGFDVEPDYSEAIKWAEKLAETHDVSAALMLGHMYANGESNTKRDLPRAYTWYAIGAGNELHDENDPNTTEEQLNNNEFIRTAQSERDKMAGLISAKEEKTAQRNASEWWLKHPVPPAKTKAGEMADKDMKDGKNMQPTAAIKSGTASH